jgi:hypothetical protein
MAHEYDTAERDLERTGLTLVRQPTEAGVEWRLGLPHGELVEAWEPGTNGLVPPAEIGRRIELLTAGKDLVPGPPPRSRRNQAADEFVRFEDLAGRLVRTSRPRRAGSGAP